MGVVYLATDTRLDRQVAIKALPADLAADPDRLARFQREAKVLASLNHPNVGGIHGLEQADGHQYLVLEYIEGETLADRLAAGPIPVAESLTLAKQIAEALEAAHEKGIIRRDLKPGNVMVTPDGVVRVLDFGLARIADGSPSSTDAPARPDSPTVASPARHSPTIPGAIMGTAGYMSPEQARGKPVDKRSDIFSFGCVLYEMLTGVGPFPGETVTDSLGAILHREPNWSLLPASTPRRVRELLTNCLAKDRKNRLHDVADARLELDRAIGGQEWVSTTSGERATRVSPLRWSLAAVVGAALLGAGWLVGRLLQRPIAVAPAQSLHVSSEVPAEPMLTGIAGISPDARFVVYFGDTPMERGSTKPRGVLVVRRLDRDETRVIETTEGAYDAALSPDGRWIAFVTATDHPETKFTLKKVALENGQPLRPADTLLELPTDDQYTICWSSDREIAVAAVQQRRILAVSASGGQPRVVLQEEQSNDTQTIYSMYPLVAGKSILVNRASSAGKTKSYSTEAVDLVTGKRTPLLVNAGFTQLVSGEFIIAVRNETTLIAARLDLDRREIVGEPATVWSSVKSVGTFSISDSGALAMVAWSDEPLARRLMLLDDQGEPQSVRMPVRAYERLQVSPDGGRVVTYVQGANSNEFSSEVWIQDLSRRTIRKLSTQLPTSNFIWSNDGQRITHNCITKDEIAIWERRADGSGDAVKMYARPVVEGFMFPWAWSPDGTTLAVTQGFSKSTNSDVLMLERDPGGSMWKATPYLDSTSAENAPRFSPDGKWIMFTSLESGRSELIVQRFTGAGSGAKDAASGRVQISTNGNLDLTSGWWMPDGKEIRYIDVDKQVVSVEVKTEPTFSVSLPRVLYSVKDLKFRFFSWTPDGALMVNMEEEKEQANRIDLIVNFADEIRAKLGAAK